MATVAGAFAIALEHHQAGRLGEAEQINQQILAVEPNHFDALHLLGVIAFQTGRHEAAIEYIGRAIGLKPTEAAFHNSLGAALQRQGRLDGAVASFGRALELKPDYSEAHSNLGTAFKHQGKLDEAVASYRRALELKPDYAEAHSNLSAALKDEGKVDEAVACCRRALELKPDFAEAHNNLGNAFKDQMKMSDAVVCWSRALELKPDFAEALNNLGTALQQASPDEAVAFFRRALAVKPDFTEAHINLGMVLQNKGDLGQAATYYGRALNSNPDLPVAHFNLGNIFKAQGKREEAAARYRRALELKPDYADAHNNLGSVLHDPGEREEAIICFRRALELNPNHVEAHANLGTALLDDGKFGQAVNCFRRALELNPVSPDAHLGQSFLMLLYGDFEHGWPEYEWRWKTGDLPARSFRQPRWNGQNLEERTILLHAEQGFGDTIQFIRYAPMVEDLGASVLVACQRPLMKLLENCAGIGQLIGEGDALPAFDVHAPLLSLPTILKTSFSTVPANVPYLFADSALVAEWRERLEDVRGFRIGINWHGGAAMGALRQRHIPFEYFAPLAQLPGVHLISLQKGAGRQELTNARNHLPIVDPGEDVDKEHGAFMDTAAIMMNLDLVITSDTSVPHLAGALGVPVWLALPFVPDWRWLLDRRDSPWYPTMRLFRQKSPGDWAGVFEEIQAALREHIESAKQRDA